MTSRRGNAERQFTAWEEDRILELSRHNTDLLKRNEELKKELDALKNPPKKYDVIVTMPGGASIKRSDVQGIVLSFHGGLAVVKDDVEILHVQKDQWVSYELEERKS